jgi:hypothetical protein
MLYTPETWHNIKELVLIPYGADKGDCPFCFYGVLGRDTLIETKFNVKEGYSCDKCSSMFLELNKRYFRRIGVQRTNISKRKG